MKTYVTIEFDTIRKRLAECCASHAAQEKALALTPFLRENEANARLLETTGARTILESMGQPPLSPMEETAQVLRLAAIGSLLTPEQLSGIAAFTVTCRRMRAYLNRAEPIEQMVSFYGRALHPLEELHEEIERCIRVDVVDDAASPLLRDLRRRMETARENVRMKLEAMLRGHKEWFSDSFIVTRGSRLALPVRRACRQQVPGTVLDTSSSGQTVFIEPAQARRFTDELAELEIAEDSEVRRILYTLTALVEECHGALSQNIGTMETLDFVFAKAKLGAQMQAAAPQLTCERRIALRAARHPLLPPERCVPLDFAIGGDITGVIITGPNTGGKTVALKTIGLLSLMAQSGLHIPAEEGSVCALHAGVLCDIGDGQSISENLSTFSAHMTNIIGILAETTHESLVLLDELGSGTDPAEGMGLAVAILEELRLRGCLFVSTSHYPEIKEYAASAPGLTNARMAFDRESLAPLYRLEMGEAGESCALHIARRLGFPEALLARAREAAYAGGGEHKAFAYTPQARQAPRRAASRVEKYTPPSDAPRACDKYQRGDSVRVFPQKEIGIVYQTADDRGNIGVQVQGQKLLVPHKRLKLLVPAESLYPDDYDFSIVFDTVENRKARHRLDKGNPNAEIRYEAEEALR